MARTLWPGKDAIGECIRVSADTMPCTTVVGIAEDAVQQSLTDPKRFRYYLPIDQTDWSRGYFLLVRTRVAPEDHVEEIRAALQRIMPGQGYVTAWPLDTVIDERRRSWEVGATMFVAFGGLALVVAAIGLYAVIGYNVTQRMHELGVRIALGAQSGDVVRLVISQGMKFALAGTIVGAVLALWAARFVEPLLFQQSARDPVVFVGVALILLLVAAAASTGPALRATRADPNQTLRSE
jgi:ABC-type antimicrobial peptide transport system permease subunit